MRSTRACCGARRDWRATSLAGSQGSPTPDVSATFVTPQRAPTLVAVAPRQCARAAGPRPLLADRLAGAGRRQHQAEADRNFRTDRVTNTTSITAIQRLLDGFAASIETPPPT